jgi:hypothetical protein
MAKGNVAPTTLTVGGEILAMAAAPFGKRVDAPPWDLAVLRRVDQTSSLVVVSGRSQPYRDTAELTATPGAIRSFPADPMSRALDLVAGDWNGDQLPDALTMEGGATPTLGGWLGAEGGGFAPLPPLELSRCIGSCALGRAPQLFDLDGDGRLELLAFCDPQSTKPRLVWFGQVPAGP